MVTIAQLRAASPNRPQANTLGAGAYWAADTRNRYWDLLVDVVEAAKAGEGLDEALARLEAIEEAKP